jgi:SAM-dependent methyltransferase
MVLSQFRGDNHKHRQLHQETAGEHMTDPALTNFWEAKYSGHSVWSGEVNQALAEVAGQLAAGRALDLGCGEGADAIWLAQRGWRVTGVDVSPTAIARASDAAKAARLPVNRVHFEVGDLSEWQPRCKSGFLAAGEARLFDLVESAFLHSWHIPIPREQILRRATTFVAPGGRFVLLSHAAAPPWANPEHARARVFPDPRDDLKNLQLAPGEWSVEICETRARAGRGPHGEQGTMLDGVLVVRREAC